MAVRRGTFNRRALVRAPQRGTFWFGGTLAFVQLAPSSSALFSIMTEADLENIPQPTIVRTRGELIVTDDNSASVAESKWEVGFGMALVERNAVAAGVASVPTPLTDVNWDGWFVHQVFLGGQVSAGSETNDLSFDRRTIDSKAMRKAGQDQVLVGIVEHGAAISGTPDIEFWGHVRILLKK